MNRENESDVPEAVLLEAAEWHLRCADEHGDEMDWDAFAAWLEQDPRHNLAFDQMALTGDALGRHREMLADLPGGILPAVQDADTFGPVHRPGILRHWRWGGLAIAASLVAVLVVPQITAPAPTVYETTASSRRISLADGSAVVLAPHSRLTVAGRAGDTMDIAGGALFDIRHDPSRSLTISAGDARISDIGTRFDVQQQDDAVRVAVAQGQVNVTTDTMAAPIALIAGSGVTLDAAAGTAVVAPVRTDDVGAWQQDRLSYDNASLALVVADLRRYARIKVDVPVALRSRRFSGTLIVDDGEKALRDLAELMGLRLRGHAGAWHLEQG